jgi:putative DNA primase/helicase
MTDDKGNVFNFDEIKKQRDQRQSGTESDSTLPLLRVDSANPDRTVAAVGEILAQSGDVFERGAPVRIARDLNIDATVAHVLDPDGFVIAVHRHSRPYVLKEGVRIDSGLPRAMATMYLSYREWALRPLNGFTSAPLLRSDGSIRTAQGYDVETGMYCEGVPDIASRIPDNVTDNDAERALASIRRRHRMLPYADAETVKEGNLTVVDLRKKPGMDESSFLTQGLIPKAPLADSWGIPESRRG